MNVLCTVYIPVRHKEMKVTRLTWSFKFESLLLSLWLKLFTTYKRQSSSSVTLLTSRKLTLHGVGAVDCRSCRFYKPSCLLGDVIYQILLLIFTWLTSSLEVGFWSSDFFCSSHVHAWQYVRCFYWSRIKNFLLFYLIHVHMVSSGRGLPLKY